MLQRYGTYFGLEQARTGPLSKSTTSLLQSEGSLGCFLKFLIQRDLLSHGFHLDLHRTKYLRGLLEGISAIEPGCPQSLQWD